MFLLTRETRFGINPGDEIAAKLTNTHAGFPSPKGFGQYFALRTTLAGELNPDTSYLRNIKDIDQIVRANCIKTIATAIENCIEPCLVPRILFDQLRPSWPGSTLHGLELSFTPFLSAGCFAKEHPMVRLSQKFEFSAAHRLHNPALSDAQNRQAFGKCNNPLGHGHNYEVQITLIGEPDANGQLIGISTFEQIVSETAIEPLDHKFLNLEVEQFRELIPSVENIAKVIYGLLKPHFTTPAKLASVTVWETPKTWCEYSE